jgi:hypothetical protein
MPLSVMVTGSRRARSERIGGRNRIDGGDRL